MSSKVKVGDVGFVSDTAVYKLPVKYRGFWEVTAVSDSGKTVHVRNLVDAGDCMVFRLRESGNWCARFRSGYYFHGASQKEVRGAQQNTEWWAKNVVRRMEVNL